MAKSLSISDIMPKIQANRAIQASASLSGFLNIKVKNIPEQQILNLIQNAINRASSRITVDLKTALDDALRSTIWNGSDIYDTGELMRSGRVYVTSTGVTVAYDAPYAALIHYGGYIHPYGNRSSVVYLPPRPWVEAVLDGNGAIAPFDFARYYKEEIEAAFR